MRMEILACALLLPAVSGGPSRRRPTGATRCGHAVLCAARQLRASDVRRAGTGPDASTRTPHEFPHRLAHGHRTVPGRTCRSQSVRTHGRHHRQGHPAPPPSRTARPRSEHLALDVWLADVRLDGQRAIRTLAAGMRRDHAAVLAALTTTFTSGAVEGNVTRIKLLKRQMYGRANFDLL
ncbi:transposase [Streptomyces sp. uw30]|uniref:transposase n=1 Tax=Streptomyces sp. uw30 TaxID=1828179 RepID=UPI0011CD40BB|nr:transposase [Streptomyces sp. uw30]TXS48522.1 transposase [Streptomyces sp. uw30]